MIFTEGVDLVNLSLTETTFVTMTVNRITWIADNGDTDLRLGMPGAPLFEPLSQSFKKKRTPSKRLSNADAACKSS